MTIVEEAMTVPQLDLDKLPFELTVLDRQTLLITDDEFIPDDWETVKKIIKENRLMDFRRYPSELRRYISWTIAMKKKYNNNMLNYLCERRLKWVPRPPGEVGSTFEYSNPTPFAEPSDYKVLFNDWPYGVSPGIIHLIVWSKTPVPVKPETGEVTEESKALIERFVDSTFREPLRKRKGKEGDDSVVWFKNWTKLQSVRAVEHFHLFVRDPDEDLITEWTQGDHRDWSVLQGKLE